MSNFQRLGNCLLCDGTLTQIPSYRLVVKNMSLMVIFTESVYFLRHFSETFTSKILVLEDCAWLASTCASQSRISTLVPDLMKECAVMSTFSHDKQLKSLLPN